MERRLFFSQREKCGLDRSGRTQAWYDFKHEHLVTLLSEILTDEDVPFRRGRV